MSLIIQQEGNTNRRYYFLNDYHIIWTAICLVNDRLLYLFS